MIRWRIDGVDAVVTDRHGGESAGPYESLNLGLHVGDHPDLVHVNRERAVGLVGGVLDELAWCTQVHGRSVVLVDGPGHAGDADALVTTTPGVVLMVLMADCVPILLVGDGVIATVHAGWRGTVADVAGATVDVMRSLGADGDIRAYLGPAVPAERYQVGPEVVAAADRAGLADAIADGEHFDLWAANRVLLERAGVVDVDTSGCVPTGDDYYSDRLVRPCGRFGLLARLRP